MDSGARFRLPNDFRSTGLARSVTPILGDDARDRQPGAAHAETVAFADHHDVSGWRVYLCGYPPMVKSAKKTAFLAGASLSDNYADPFELRELRKKPR